MCVACVCFANRNYSKTKLGLTSPAANGSGSSIGSITSTTLDSPGGGGGRQTSQTHQTPPSPPPQLQPQPQPRAHSPPVATPASSQKAASTQQRKTSRERSSRKRSPSSKQQAKAQQQHATKSESSPSPIATKGRNKTAAAAAAAVTSPAAKSRPRIVSHQLISEFKTSIFVGNEFSSNDISVQLINDAMDTEAGKKLLVNCFKIEPIPSKSMKFSTGSSKNSESARSHHPPTATNTSSNPNTTRIDLNFSNGKNYIRRELIKEIALPINGDTRTLESYLENGFLVIKCRLKQSASLTEPSRAAGLNHAMRCRANNAPTATAAATTASSASSSSPLLKTRMSSSSDDLLSSVAMSIAATAPGSSHRVHRYG